MRLADLPAGEGRDTIVVAIADNKSGNVARDEQSGGRWPVVMLVVTKGSLPVPSTQVVSKRVP